MQALHIYPHKPSTIWSTVGFVSSTLEVASCFRLLSRDIRFPDGQIGAQTVVVPNSEDAAGRPAEGKAEGRERPGYPFRQLNMLGFGNTDAGRDGWKTCRAYKEDNLAPHKTVRRRRVGICGAGKNSPFSSQKLSFFLLLSAG